MSGCPAMVRRRMETGSASLFVCHLGIDPFPRLWEPFPRGARVYAQLQPKYHAGGHTEEPSGKKRDSGPGHSAPADNRANRSTCHNADTYPDGQRVRSCANCHADSDSDGYPDRHFLTFHAEFSSDEPASLPASTKAHRIAGLCRDVVYFSRSIASAATRFLCGYDAAQERP